MIRDLSQTPLHSWHAAHGGRMVDFAGWSMPVQYASIVAEHNATRTAVGLFDVSHMGRFRLDGASEAFLDRVVTRQVAGMKPGQIRYSLVTNEAGGILDDVLVYHLCDARGQDCHVLVVNASNRQKIWDWLAACQPGGDVRLWDCTLETAMVAVQGPRAIEIVHKLVSVDPSSLRYYTGATGEFAGAPVVVSRTGYTGEDGCELIVPAGAVVELWQRLLAAAEPFGGMAAGLGCRDTLRLEAGMPLYGHELNEDIDPFQAGLDFAVNLERRSFPGRDALAKLREHRAAAPVGLQLAGKRVPREGYAVLAGEQAIGHVTSGTFSPTLNRPSPWRMLCRKWRRRAPSWPLTFAANTKRLAS